MRYFRILYVLLFITRVFNFFKAPNDPDFGWHYKYGEYAVQNSSLLKENIYSFTFTDYDWANSYWLSEVILFITHSNLGHLASGMLFSVILSAFFFLYIILLQKHLKAGKTATILLLVLVPLYLSTYLLPVRPMFYSTLFIMFLTYILLTNSISTLINKKIIFIIPLIFALWPNLHADFVLGLFMFGTFVFFEGILGFYCKRVSKKELLVLLSVSIISVFATLLNPYGIDLWQTLIKESNPYQFSHITEWLPTGTGNIPSFAMYCGVIGFVIFSLIRYKKVLPLWYMLVLILFTVLSIRSRYFFRLELLIGVYAFFLGFSDFADVIKKGCVWVSYKKIRIALLFIIVISLLSSFEDATHQIRQSVDEDYWVSKQDYPKNAIEYMLASDYGANGRVFNWYGWGGYMIWKYPNIKTFVDGRMPSWREGSVSIFEDYINISKNSETNILKLHDHDISWILFPVEDEFSEYLRQSDKWREVYKDAVSSVFVIIRQ